MPPVRDGLSSGALAAFLHTLRNSRLIDLSQPLEEHMPHYPAHSKFFHNLWGSYWHDDRSLTYQLVMNEHNGTHVDYGDVSGRAALAPAGERAARKRRGEAVRKHVSQPMICRISLAFAVLVVPFPVHGQTPSPAPPSPADCPAEFRTDLQQGILKFWIDHAIDHQQCKAGVTGACRPHAARRF